MKRNRGAKRGTKRGRTHDRLSDDDSDAELDIDQTQTEQSNIPSLSSDANESVEQKQDEKDDVENDEQPIEQSSDSTCSRLTGFHYGPPTSKPFHTNIISVKTCKLGDPEWEDIMRSSDKPWNPLLKKRPDYVPFVPPDSSLNQLIKDDILKELTSQQSNQQLPSHAKKRSKSNKQSGSSITIKSLLHRVPTVLFSEICAYLTVEDKCSSLFSLSRTVHDTLNSNLDQCFKGWLTINLPEIDKNSHTGCNLIQSKQHATNQVIGRLQYTNFANFIAVNCPGAHVKNSSLLDLIENSTIESILHGALIGLYLCEKCPVIGSQKKLPTDYMNCTIIRTLASNNYDFKTKHLWLDLLRRSTRAEEQHDILGCCIPSLERCNSLTVLRISFPPDHLNIISVQMMFCYLPHSLEEFYLETDFENEEILDQSALYFTKPDYLSFLQIFEFRDRDCGSMYVKLPCPLTTTIQTKTGKIRPLKALRLDSDGLTVDAIMPLESTLTSLDLKPFADVNAGEKFCADLLACSADHFPHLRRFSLIDPNVSTFLLVGQVSKIQIVDPSPFFEFASRYPVEEIVLNPITVRTGFTQAALTGWASMKSLKRLEIGGGLLYNTGLLNEYQPPIHVDIYAGLFFFQPDAWPKLESLQLQYVSVDKMLLSSILEAAASCRHLALCCVNDDISHSLLLAMSLRYCPNVVDLYLSSRVIRETDAADVISQFRQYKIHPLGVRHLIKLSLPMWRCSEHVLHLVVSHLSVAPHLALLDLPPVVDTQSLLALCCFRALPHLVTLPALERKASNTKQNSLLTAPALEDCVEHVRTPEFISPMQRYWKDKNRFDSKYHPETLNEFIGEMFGYDTTYKAFRKPTDEDPSDGRSDYFDALFMMLNRKQKKKLTGWESGNHDSSSDDEEEPTKPRTFGRNTINQVWSYYTG